MLTYLVRASTAAEGKLLVDLWRSSVAATHGFVSASDMAAIDAEVEDFLPSMPAFVAVGGDDRPVGFMGLSGHSVDALFIAGEHRGRGAGRSLVEFAMQRHRVLKTIVNEENEQAVGFYRRMGFRFVRRSPVDDGGRPYPILEMRWRRATG